MASQTFTIQSPEQIAKDYGGNKQKIAEAMQMGILDPTAGTLAGMFIDRMRSAAQAEGAPQQTVAEQVFAPPAPSAPSAPPMGAPMGAPAGLGATPEAAAMPQQEMGMPPQEMAPPQEMPAMPDDGMVPAYAMGGMADLPVPDAMFDEPNNGGYAGGGMVAFAPGGTIDATRLRRSLLMQESSGDFGETNKSGAMGGYQFMPPTARALAKRLGIEYRPDLMVGNKGRSKDGIAYQERLMDAQMEDILAYSAGDVGKASRYHFAGPNEKQQGAKTRQYEKEMLRRYSGSKDTGGDELVDAAQGDDTLYGLPTNLRGNVDLARSLIPEQSAEDIEYRKELTERLSPENRKRDKKDAFFEGLGKLGARLGNARDKSLLGGLAETLGAGAGDIAESLDADEKRIREMQRERSALANATRKEQMDAVAMGFDLTGKVAQLNEGIESRKMDVMLKREQLQMQQDEFDLRREEAQATVEAAGLKFDLDKYLITEMGAGGVRAENAKAYAVLRYGDRGDEAGPFGLKLKGKSGAEDPFAKFSATRN